MSFISTYPTPREQIKNSIVSLMAEGVSRLYHRVAQELATWRRRSRERAELRGMSDLDLGDIGLSRSDVFYESAKPVWRE